MVKTLNNTEKDVHSRKSVKRKNHQVDQIPIFQRSTADQQCTPQTSGVPSGNPKQELKNLPNAKLSRILKIGAVLHESHLGSRQNLGRIPRNARAVGLLIEISARQMRPN